MQTPSLVMSRPTVELVASYLQFIDEMRTHGDRIWEGMVPAGPWRIP